MSQTGKVLHLYVEVRSAPDQNGGKEAFAESEEIARGHSGQDSPGELLSQLAGQTASRAATVRRLVQDCTHSQSPSRNSAGFQLQQGSSSPTISNRWSSPCEVTVPNTPPNCQAFKEDGKRSVVTFSYVEKSNVKTVDSPRRSLLESGTKEERSTYFQKRLSDPVWFGSPDSSRSSSPKLTFQSPGRHQQTFSPSLRQPSFDAIGRAATQRAVEEFGSPLLRIKLAHALEHTSSRYSQQPRCQSWAGSPVQRQNISINLKDPITDRNQTLCGLPRSTASDQLSSQTREPQSRPGSCGVSQSPPHWSGEDRSVAGSPAAIRQIHRACNRRTSPQGAILQLGNNIVEGLNQLSDSKCSSPAQSPEVACSLAREATKLSDPTETRKSSLHNALGESDCGGVHSSAPCTQMLQMNIPLNEQNMPAPGNTDSHQPENPVPHPHETNPHLNYGTHQAGVNKSHHQSTVFSAAQSSPGLPSRVLRPSHPPTELSSPLRDPRLFQAELRAPDTPTLHRRQPPQYTGDSWSSSPDRRGDLCCFEEGDCADVAQRLFNNDCVEEAPVSWTSRQQWGRDLENTPRPEPPSNNDQTPNHQSGHRRRPLSPTAQQKRAEQRRREILLLGPVALDSPEEDEGCDEADQGNVMEGYGPGQQPRGQRVQEHPEAEQNGVMGGSSSRSSSGVTGSLGDRDCVSPETSQSSHHSNETGAATSGIQVGSRKKDVLPRV